MAIDVQWANVSLLLPFSESLLDVKGHTVTPVGGAALSSAVGTPFGAGNALYLDGVDDYLSLADSADWSLGGGDFTIEAWAMFSSHTTSLAIFGQRTSSTSDYSYSLYYNTGTLYFSYTTDGYTIIDASAPWTPTNGVWYFISVVRSGTSIVLKVDGVQVGSTHTVGSAVIHNSASEMKVGARSTSPQHFFDGHLSNIRITKVGRTIYLPTAPFPRPTIKGIVLDASAAPAAKVVKAFKRSTMLLTGEAISNGSTGLYTIYPSDFTEHVVVRFDTATTPLVDGGSGEVALNYDRVIPGG